MKIFLDKIQEIIYTCGEVMSMDFPTKIKMAEAVAKVKEAELARRMDTTPRRGLLVPVRKRSTSE